MYPLLRCVHTMSIVATKKKTLQNAIAETHAKLFFSFASFTFGLLRLDSDIIALCLSHIHCCTDMSCTSCDCNRKSTNNSSAHSCKAFTQTNTQFGFFGKCTEKSARRFSVSFFSWIWTLEFSVCPQCFSPFLFSLAFFCELLVISLVAFSEVKKKSIRSTRAK